MRFIAGGLNGNFLQEIAERAHTEAKCRLIQAAISYAADKPKLFEFAKKHKAKLEFWGRYDHSVPIAPHILKDFLDTKSANFSCRLVPDILHSKIIWWHGYGAYFGSANLTDRGWINNIEGGIFIKENDLAPSGMINELLSFFSEVNKKSYALSDEIYKEALELTEQRKKIRTQEQENEHSFLKRRKLPKNEKLQFIAKKNPKEKRRNNFLAEWNETLQTLRNIGELLSKEYRPTWIEGDVAAGIHTDRFLHYYYINTVKKKNKSHHQELHEQNKADTDKALEDAMKWWEDIDEAPSHVEERIKKSAPYLQKILSAQNIKHISKEDMIEICMNINAIDDHASKVPWKNYGLTEPLPTMSSKDRTEFHAKWLYDLKIGEDNTALDTLHYVLHGGSISEIPERLWEADNNTLYKIPELGVNGLGELVGWAFPETYTPRNGRTSKALYALGYNVVIHSN